MGLLRDLANVTSRAIERRSNPLNDPSIPLSSPAVWQWLMGGEPTAAGELINESNALQITTVYACVRVIATASASSTCKLYELFPSGRQEAIDEDLYYLLAVEPNPEMSAFTYWETRFGSCALTGNAYAQIERNDAKQPVALWPLHPLKTRPFRAEDRKIWYKTSDGMSGCETRIVPSEDILHTRLFSFDGLCGISPIQLARQSLGLAKATEKFGARFFGNGSKPGGVMMNKGPKPDPKAQAEIVESWSRAQGGVNQGKTAFLFGGEWSYQQVGLSPEDSQFLTTRAFTRADIAQGIYGVPPHMVGDTTRLSNSNHEQQSLQFVTDTLRPGYCREEVEVVRKLLPRRGRKANKFVVGFDVSERLRGDFATTQAGYATGRQWGWYSANDVLRKLGENVAGPELDVYLVPVNMQNAERLLDTESVQDQPLGGDPNAPEAIPVPTPAERSFLGPLTQAYIPMFRDAVGRLTARNKRDYEAVSRCFGPVLTSISDEATRQATEEFQLADGWNVAAQRTVKDAVISIRGRAHNWTATDADKNTGTELTRAVRSILLNTYREAGAALALKGTAHAATE